MRIKNSIRANRSTLFLLAMFSCLQITLGFILIIEEGDSKNAPSSTVAQQHNYIEITKLEELK